MINGTLLLVPGTSTTIHIDPNNPIVPIIVTGTATLDGTLTIVLSDTISNGTLLPIVGGSGDINGTFSDVSIEDANRECDNVKGNLQHEDSSGGLAVLVTVSSGCGSKSRNLTTGQIAGICVGAVLFLAIVVAVVIAFVHWRMPHHRIFHKDTENETRYFEFCTLTR